MNVLRFVVLTGILFIVIGSSGEAQYAEDVYRFSRFDISVGTRSLGMGNAAVGLADDYSALFWNPAGLASLRDFEFSAGFSRFGYKNDVSFLGTSAQADLSAMNLSNLGVVYPIATIRGSLTFAFGYGRAANYTTTASFNGFNDRSSIIESLTPYVNVRSMSSSERRRLLEENIPFQIFLADTVGGFLFPVVYDSVQQIGRVDEGGGLNNWSVGGAIDIARDLSVGVAVNLLSGSYRYDREYTEVDSRNVYTYTNRFDAFHRFTYISTITSDITGFNALLGIMYRKPGRFKVGASIRTPTLYEISENFSDEGESEFDPNADGVIDRFRKTVSGSTKYEIRTPPIVSVGGSLQISDWLVLAGDAEYTDWTQMEFRTNNADLLAENRLIKRIFEPTTNLRGGAEVTLWNLGVQLRGGVVYNPSPYKNDPSEFDQLYYTGGIGIKLEQNIFVNTSFAVGKWTTIRDNYYVEGLTTPSRTREKVQTNNMGVTLSYRF